jgi:hypothetical protein
MLMAAGEMVRLLGAEEAWRSTTSLYQPGTYKLGGSVSSAFISLPMGRILLRKDVAIEDESCQPYLSKQWMEDWLVLHTFHINDLTFYHRTKYQLY